MGVTDVNECTLAQQSNKKFFSKHVQQFVEGCPGLKKSTLQGFYPPGLVTRNRNIFMDGLKSDIIPRTNGYFYMLCFAVFLSLSVSFMKPIKYRGAKWCRFGASAVCYSRVVAILSTAPLHVIVFSYFKGNYNINLCHQNC